MEPAPKKTRTRTTRTAPQTDTQPDQATAAAPPPVTRKPRARKTAAPAAEPQTDTQPDQAAAAAPTAELATGVAELAEPTADALTLGDFRSHVAKKGMWAGAVTPVAIAGLAGLVPADSATEDPPAAESEPQQPAPGWRVAAIEAPHTPALLTAFGELLTNATDHVYGTAGSRRAVDRAANIAVEFDPRTGQFAITNDGPGIPVAVHAAASAAEHRPVYSVEVAFARFLAGTNLDKSTASVKGGTNGLGAKIANVHAARFTVSTTDTVAGLQYRQEFRDRLTVVGPPEVVPAPKGARGSTRVEFMPAYAALGYPPAGSPELAARLGELASWLRLRVALAAAYVGDLAAVTLNGEVAPAGSVPALAAALAGAGAASCPEFEMRAPLAPFPWRVAAFVRGGRRSAAPAVLAAVNGTPTPAGAHVDRIRDLLWDEVVRAVLAAKGKRAAARGSAKGSAAASAKEALGADEAARLRRKFGDALGLVIVAPLPGAEWGAQSKDRLQVPAGVVAPYVVPGGRNATALRDTARAFVDLVLVERVAASTFAHSARKYSRAQHAGGAQRAHCSLLVAEGDSAMGLLRAGLSGNRGVARGGPSFEWMGIISVQGVIMNTMQQIRPGPGGVPMRSTALQNNDRLNALMDAMGLRPGLSYETDSELATLKYGRIVICVDQDQAGTGKIAPLICLWIWCQWPALFRAGRVARMMTPLVRAYARTGNAPPVEFLYQAEFESWVAADPGRVPRHRIAYYKGLAAHDAAEARRMFAPEVFDAMISKYTVDECAAAAISTFYSADAEPRRRVLALPPPELTPTDAAALRAARELPLGRVQVRYEAHDFSLSAIRSQIPNVIDGLTPARRKVLFGSFLRWANGGAAAKVYMVAGYIAEHARYHFGDASLTATITNMAKSFVGANRYPLLVGVGQFGSRYGDEAGSARYIGVRLSPLARAAFPVADRAVLPRVFEDGDPAEPRTYAPVAPLAILESAGGSLVSVGWNHSSFGRDSDDVAALLDAMLAGAPEALAALAAVTEFGPDDARAAPALAAAAARWPLRPAVRDYPRGTVVDLAGVPTSLGAYLDGDAAPAPAPTSTTKPRAKPRGRATPATPAAPATPVAQDVQLDVVTVVELPQGVSTIDFVERLERLVTDRTIAGFVDRSGSDCVDVRVDFGPGGRARLPASPNGLDPVVAALGLSAPLHSRLNFIHEPLTDLGAGTTAAEPAPTHRKIVIELGSSYHAAFFAWAGARREIYRRRLAREAAVAELRAELLSAIADYADRAAELALSDLDDQAAEDALRRAGLPRLDAGMIRSPPATPTPASLAAFILAARAPSGVSGYDYILALRGHDLRPADAGKRRAAASRAVTEHAAAATALAEQPIAGASVWRAEFAEFQAAVARGLATGWSFENERQHHDE